MGSGRRMYLLACLAFYSLYSLAAASQLKIMTAPNVLRVGTEENIFVECQGCTEEQIPVTIILWDFPSKTRELGDRSVVILDKNNEFQQFGKIKIPPDTFTADDDRNKYVYVQAQFPDKLLEKVVLVSFQSGYIFIQTDKTLYTPGSPVKFRLFGVTPQVLPLDEAATSIGIEIMTPQDVALSLPKGPFSLISGYYDGTYQLSILDAPGVYKVVAKFLSNPQYVYSAEFEVKEYVLPNFEVKLKPKEAFFLVDREELIIDIEAKYLFNEKVEGTAAVIFGVVNEGEKKPFPSSVQRADISEGNGKATLKKADMHPYNIDDLARSGSFLFVHASVQTEDGAEMVHAELRNIKVVSSPYIIYFRRTPKYFKPGMDFDVVVETLNPDGTPAEQVEVVLEPMMVTGRTEKNGMARLSINTNPTLRTLVITARTNNQGPQARSTMTVVPYDSPSESYIHIGVGKAEVKVGENLKVLFNYNQRQKGRDITYLVLSKGQLVKYDRYKITDEVVISRNLQITKDMMPSFRIVAYYYTQNNEVVADSVWVDVQDSCMGSLTVELENRDSPVTEPGENIKLKITGDPGATVNLVAVDKGVFLLNNNLRLTQQKIWDTVEKQDIGCTPGGGQNNMGVFYDAGLMFSSSASVETPSRQELKCPSPSRRKRSNPSQNLQISLVSQYTDKNLRDCCLDGMKKTPLSYTCERRSQYIIDGAQCVQAFLRCCEEMETLETEEREDSLTLARSDESDDGYNPDEIVSRSKFPESWHWTSVELPDCKETTCTVIPKPFPLKDTITTWEFIGISFSRENSICVAKPLPVIAKKNFFVKLHLPYSVVRGEQVQIKAVVYNYRSSDATVRVELVENVKVCSAASSRKFYRQEIRIPAGRTRAVPFVIIPKGLGLLDIEVKAAVKGRDSDVRDGVIKKLFVVSEGKLMNKVDHLSLDLKDGREEATINSRVRTHDLVPDAPTKTLVLVTGKNQLSSLMTNIISGESLGHMIQLPSGCGEQNMFGMTMTVIATVYLDKTDQWEKLGVDRRKKAIEHIQTGYNNELHFRKPDGSFAVFTDRPGSTWLTAYVAKVFALAHRMVAVKADVVCDALSFLMNQQQDNGRFRDIGTIIHQNMMGDLRGKDSDASMTAFCLMAMQEARRLCHKLDNLQDSMDRATGYLEGRLPALTNPYAVTITSYALAFENKLNRQILKNFMSAESTHWPVDGSDMFTIEATAYGLLALVKDEALDEAKPIVSWLQEHQGYSGGYGSTQVTIMVYQAIAEYWSKVTDQAYNLDINLKLPGRSSAIPFFINRENYMSTRSNELDLINEDVKVVATGTGEATVKVVSFYYARLIEKKSNCRKFYLNVTLTQDDIIDELYSLSIKVKYLDTERDAAMAILDIALLTGFEPEENDLKALSTGPSRVIRGYETNTKQAEGENQKKERGTLIIYLDKVSHEEVEEITFGVRQKMPSARLQPAAVTIYEYYDLHNQNDTNCVRFYHPKRPAGELLMLCRRNTHECECAEEDCTKQKKEKVSNEDRIDQSCLSTHDTKTDYVFKVEVMSRTEEESLDVYTMQVVQVIKEGTDKGALGREREFLSYKHCKWALDLRVGKTYLIMGADKDVKIDQQSRTYYYVLGERTWIEYWPTDEECQSEKEEFVTVCNGIAELKYKYEHLLCRQ